MNISISRGFTLAEMMVVVVILGLLVAIIAPYMSGVSSQARALLCKNNLNKINQATQAWASRKLSWDQHALAESGWTAVVQTETNGTEVMRCPEGGILAEGQPIESLFVIRTSPTSSTGVPLVEIFQDGGFAAGYKLLKFSGTQFSRLRECGRITPEPYVPDSNPNVYYWCYDDGAVGSGDYDFQDLTIRVTNNGGGTASMFAIADTGGNPEVWSPDFAECFARTQDINQHHHSGKGTEWELSTGGTTHYGMNIATIDMRMGNKIQAMDYLSAKACSTDNWDAPGWDEDEDGIPDFLRHNGKMNVSMVDGSVQTRNRWEVDPVDVDVERTLWQK